MLVPTYYVEIGPYNIIKKKNSTLWMIIAQKEPNLMRGFSYSWVIVFRTLKNIHSLYDMFEKESLPN